MHDVGHGQHLTSNMCCGALGSNRFAEHVMKHTVPSSPLIAMNAMLALILTRTICVIRSCAVGTEKASVKLPLALKSTAAAVMS